MKIIKIFVSLLFVLTTICSHASFAQQSQDNLSHEKLIKQYYAAYEQKDWHMLELILDDGFTSAARPAMIILI